MKFLCMILTFASLAVQKPDPLVLVNKNNICTPEYEAAAIDALEPVLHTRADGRPMQYLQKEAAYALDQLLFAAEKAGYNITVTSAYRSRKTQTRIYDFRRERYVSKGIDEENASRMTERYVAPPGYSEHHTGLAVDMHSMASAEVSFADTDEFRWLCENAPKYGFILRYPRGKENITGYAFEPWHFRYVGDAAKYITENGQTLEEYLEDRTE